MANHAEFSRAATNLGEFFSNSITITSDAGAGKSRTIELLRMSLTGRGEPWRFVSGGGIMRIFAKQHGLTIEQFVASLTTPTATTPEHYHDRLCDDRIARFGEQNYVVSEGRIVHALVPRAFHVRLVCPLEIRAERRYQDRKKEGEQVTLEAVTKEIADRDTCDNTRNPIRCPGCIWPDEDFDLVINTRDFPPDVVAGQILLNHSEWVRRLRSEGVGRIIDDVCLPQ